MLPKEASFFRDGPGLRHEIGASEEKLRQSEQVRLGSS